MAEVQAQLAPGVRQTDLTATFLRTIFELGAEANILDPIWQVMPTVDEPTARGRRTGDLACPLLIDRAGARRGRRALGRHRHHATSGYHSDFGRTWVVGARADARQQAQFERWRAIIDAVLDVTRAGVDRRRPHRGGDRTWPAATKPWMSHFYLGHGLGIDSAETPYVGSDLGEAFDAGLVLQPGTVARARADRVGRRRRAATAPRRSSLITEDGWEPITDYPYDPF